jgi:hypothetical protein
MHPHQRDEGDMMGFAGRIRRRTLLTGTAIAIGGGLVGAVTAASVSASAASTAATVTSASSPSAMVSSTTVSSAPGGQHDGAIAGMPGHPGGFGLDLTGTVTSVGSSSVTIKTSSGVIKTYKVDASSDIDKNGEAKLSSLTVGDAVRYSLASGTNTIDKLHAGSEAKDAPGRPPAGMPGHPGGVPKHAPSGEMPGGMTPGSGSGA